MLALMGFEVIIIVALSAIVFAIVGVIAAMATMRKNQKRYEESPEKHTRGEVMKTLTRTRRYTDVTSLNTDPELAGWRYSKGNHLIQLLRDDGVFMLLDCDEKVYKKIVTGYYGDITYKANVLIDFRRRKSHEEERRRMQNEEPYFFKNKGSQGKTVGFYVDAPSLKLKIPAEEMMQCDIYEVKNYADRMFENTSENFFGLDDGKTIIQFFNDGTDQKVSIDIPDMKRNGSYQAELDGMYDLMHLIDIYFSSGDINEAVKLEFMEFER